MVKWDIVDHYCVKQFLSMSWNADFRLIIYYIVLLFLLFADEQMVAMQFGNMSTTGIPDSVWRIPASCNN